MRASVSLPASVMRLVDRFAHITGIFGEVTVEPDIQQTPQVPRCEQWGTPLSTAAALSWH